MEEEQGNGYVADIVSGTQIGFKYFMFRGIERRVRIRIRGDFCGQVYVMTDGGTDTRLTGKAGKIIGKTDISVLTKEWTDLETDIMSTEGKHSLYSCFSGEGRLDFYEFEGLI